MLVTSSAAQGFPLVSILWVARPEDGKREDRAAEELQPKG